MLVEWILSLWPDSLTARALLIGLLVGVAVYQLRKKRYRLPPGPPGWPLLGNILDFGKGNMFRTMEKWSKIYGPVLTIRLGPGKMVVLNNIEVVTEALVTRQADFAGRAFSYTFDILTEGSKDIAFATYGPRWKLHRKLASKAIRGYLLSDSLDKSMSRSLKICTELMLQQDQPFDPYRHITFLVFNVIYGMCFSKFSESLQDRYFKCFLEGMEIFYKEAPNGLLEDFIPPLRLFPTRAFRRVMETSSLFHSGVKENLQERRATFEPGKVRDFADAMLQAQRDIELEEDPALMAQITDTHIDQTLLDIYGAGIDTSRITLTWCVLAMCFHPDIQEKVHQEVDAVIGDDLVVKVADRASLPYTEAVVHEAMRMRPAAPIGVPHSTLCDTSVGGFEIPKGTAVMTNLHALHFDPKHWDTPFEFRPERFLDASGKMASKPESWLPFSAGRRVCLGETIAKPELHLLFAGMMRAVSVSLAPGETHDFEPTPGANNLPGPFKVVIKSRIKT